MNKYANYACGYFGELELLRGTTFSGTGLKKYVELITITFLRTIRNMWK